MDDDDILEERALLHPEEPEEDALELLRQLREDQPEPDIEHDSTVIDEGFYDDEYDAGDWIDRGDNDDYIAQWE